MNNVASCTSTSRGRASWLSRVRLQCGRRQRMKSSTDGSRINGCAIVARGNIRSSVGRSPPLRGLSAAAISVRRGYNRGMRGADSDFEFHPLSPERWLDLVKLFEHHGNPGYCWCMTWRATSAEYKQLDAAGRKRALYSRVKARIPTGILAYREDEPIGWCSIAPRETYARLEHSTTLKRLDDQPVWSVVCFFVSRRWRRQGLALQLLRAAVKHAAEQGAQIIEGYPVEPGQSYQFMGSPAIFTAAGFREVARATNDRPIVRFIIGDKP
jgi:GNAT superfamily N-acetyltransferase